MTHCFHKLKVLGFGNCYQQYWSCTYLVLELYQNCSIAYHCQELKWSTYLPTVFKLLHDYVLLQYLELSTEWLFFFKTFYICLFVFVCLCVCQCIYFILVRSTGSHYIFMKLPNYENGTWVNAGMKESQPSMASKLPSETSYNLNERACVCVCVWVSVCSH